MNYGKIIMIFCSLFLVTGVLVACKLEKKDVKKNMQIEKRTKGKDEREIYLAAGCFWGTQAFMERIDGVKSVTVGYANGKTEDTDYQKIGKTDHAETAHIIYDPKKTNLTTILAYYFKIIDPTSVNRQGNDIGRQYRTGIYYTDLKDKNIIDEFLKMEQKKYKDKIVVEVEPLKNYILAEEYHQKYLDKNPGGYCHIDLNKANEKIKLDELKPLVKSSEYSKENTKHESVKIKVFKKKSKEELKKELTQIQFDVTQNSETERPYTNEYFDKFDKGIYVDITTGQPLFLSTDKFDSGCGWPSFSKPIQDEDIEYKNDISLGMQRIEVRSKIGDAHLGHVFNDGPRELGGKRYCINSASLKFIPYLKMEEEGYGEYMKYLDNK